MHYSLSMEQHHKKVCCGAKQCCSLNKPAALPFNDHIFLDSTDGLKCQVTDSRFPSWDLKSPGCTSSFYCIPPTRYIICILHTLQERCWHQLCQPLNDMNFESVILQSTSIFPPGSVVRMLTRLKCQIAPQDVLSTFLKKAALNI